jgi:hypothetical protein
MPHHRYSTRRLLLALPVLIAFSGCSTIDSLFSKAVRDSGASDGYLTSSGVNQLFNEKQFEQIDLFNLLDPDQMRHHCPTLQGCDSATLLQAKTKLLENSPASPNDTNPLHKTEQEEKQEENLERAFSAFYLPYYGSKRDLMDRRNRIQDRILAASEQRCNAYKTYLQRTQSEQEALFGTLTTVLAGAGAIVTGESHARLLAGLAGISSGVGAEWKQAYFANLATRVIVPGIEKRRRSIMAEIESNRSSGQQPQSISTYTVERAIQDADRFHGACSLVSGIDEAAVSLNPGLKAIGQSLAELRNVNLLANPNTLKNDASTALSALLKGAVVGKVAASTTESTSNAPLAAVGKLALAFNDLADKLAAATAQTQSAGAKTPAGKQQLKLLLDGTAALRSAQAATLGAMRGRFFALPLQQSMANPLLSTDDAKNDPDKQGTCVSLLANNLNRLGQAAANHAKTPLDTTWLAQMQALHSGMAPYGCP